MTKPTFFVEEDKILTSLFDEGMDDLHIYKPATSPVFSERLLSLLPENYYKKITVHDHFYLKNEYGLGGIHIDSPTDNLPDGYKGHYSRSCTAVEQLKLFKKKAEYVFLRNIFNSLSERDERSNFTMNQLEDASKRGLIDKHVYALGGMSLDNLRVAKELGFGGVVICGDLWNRFDIHRQTDFKELIQQFERIKKAIS